MKFKLHSNYQPRGDQPTAIDQLYGGVDAWARTIDPMMATY